METKKILDMEIGDKETMQLEAAKVTIRTVELQEIQVKDKLNYKISCIVKHPSRDDCIAISSVKYEKVGKLQTTGLWVNFDEDDKIRKGSALALLMNHLKVRIPKEMEGKEVETTIDEKGYLCFKVY